jgi:uncharacterized protein with PIN domain
MPFPRCAACGKRLENCECEEADEDDKNYSEAQKADTAGRTGVP